MKRSMFLIWKRAIFCQIKEIKHLSGGVVLYAAQTNALVDAELVKKGLFRTETRLAKGAAYGNGSLRLYEHCRSSNVNE